MRRLLMWSSILVVVVGGLGAFAWYRSGKSKDGPKYQTAKLDKGQIIAKITATGTLSPLRTVQVGSQVSGRISEIDADFNSIVTKGQVIAKIDPQNARADVQRAEANLAAARANLARARALSLDADRQAERARQLAEKKLVAQSEADTAQSQADAARAEVTASGGAVQQAQAALDQAKLSLSYTTIYSPIDGIVISRSVDVGQTVTASFTAPTLFTIAEDLRKMQVDTSVSEGDVGRLQPGQDVTFTVDAFPGKSFPGKVRQIRNSPQTVQNVVTYDAVIDIENPKLELKPGMTATVTFIVGQKDEALRVPNAALRFRPPPDVLAKQKAAHEKKAAAAAGDGGPSAKDDVAPDATSGASGKRGKRPHGDDTGDMKTVWRLENGELVPSPVKVGISDGQYTEIVDSKLKEGDEIITDLASPSSASKPPPGPPRMRF